MAYGGETRKDAGVVALEVYFPSFYVCQKELEQYDQCVGKYTIGLGQSRMALCEDNEDVQSLALSAVSLLLRKHNINPKDVGRLEIGTESMIDMSKSVKSVLMTLFQDSGNHDIEGIDNVNGCYGATNAIFNAVQWIESSFWDERYAIVVATDCAIYSEGPARATGGCGAIAMLIGANASLVLSPPRGSFMDHVYDFYKPTLREHSYPIVDGYFSVSCYMKALHQSYIAFTMKYKKQNKGNPFFSFLKDTDYVVFHSPYCKIVEKAFSRLVLYDAKQIITNGGTISDDTQQKIFEKFGEMPIDEIYSRFSAEKELIDLSKDLFMKYTSPSLYLPENLGNLYTGSAYAALLSLINTMHEDNKEKRILMFSYGSGCASSMFLWDLKSLDKLRSKEDLENRLESRTAISPEKFLTKISQLEAQKLSGFVPQSSVDNIKEGAYYLHHIDNKYRRFYEQRT